MSTPRADTSAEERAIGPPRRRGRRIVAALALGLAAAVGSLVVWRATSLRGLPDVGDPFDVASFAPPVADDANAYTFYRRAAEMAPAPLKEMRWSYTDGSSVGEARKELEAHREALAVWYEGTTRERALYRRPEESTFETTLPVSQKLRDFVRLALLKSFLLQQEGDYAGAWDWLCANLRCSRHLARNGVIIERLIAVAIESVTASQAIHWADDPKLDARALRKALDDLLAFEADPVPFSRMYQAEYIVTKNSIDDPGLRDRILDVPGQSLARTILLRLDRVRGFLLHEPERSRRVIRLVWANWLSACDLPAAERQRRAIPRGTLTLYAPGPEGTAMPPDELARWVDSTRYARMLIPASSGVHAAMARAERGRASLVVHLAERLYAKEHGKEPASARELVGPYLKSLPDGYDPASNPPGSSR